MPPECGVECERLLLGLGQLISFDVLHSGGEGEDASTHEVQVGLVRLGVARVEAITDRVPIAVTQIYGELRICPVGHVVVHHPRGLPAHLGEHGGVTLRLFDASAFGEGGDQVHHVMKVIPIVLDALFLRGEIRLVHLEGVEKGGAGALVVAGAIEDVSRHVYHMAGGGGEFADNLSAVQRGFGVVAAFDGVDPVMVGGGAVRMLGERLAEQRLGIYLSLFGPGAALVSAFEFEGEEEFGVDVLGEAVDDLLPKMHVSKRADGSLRVVVFVVFVRLRGFDIKLLVFAGGGRKLVGFFERDGDRGFVGVGIERFGAVDAPVAHGTFGIEAGGLAEGAQGFVVPEIVQQIEALIEPNLRFGGAGCNREMAVADALHVQGRSGLGGSGGSAHVRAVGLGKRSGRAE